MAASRVIKKMDGGEEKPVVIYNADKKEMIGVFASIARAVKYLYFNVDAKKYAKLYYALKNAKKTKCLLFDFKIAARYAYGEKLELLNGNYFHISEGYPIPHVTQMKGFTSTCEYMKKEWFERNDRRLSEINNKKQRKKFLN